MTAIVTGGSGGIGSAVCAKLAKGGANILVNYNDSEDAAIQAVKELNALGVDAIAYPADIADEAAVQKMISAAYHRWGQIDILINNAGYTKYVSHANLGELDDLAWQQTLAVNLLGPWHASKAASHIMRDKGKGAIVNVASTAALSGTGSSVAYAASKAGLIAMTKAMARALAPNIRVNAVAPGMVNTGWLRRYSSLDENGIKKLHEKYISQTPMRRIVSADEVAEAIVWLAADATGVTGEIVTVDGGHHLRMG
jgi:3-oxoacyl-[acyl-carrier protein] reductase